MTFTTILYVALGVSLIMNLVLGWFARNLSIRYLFLSESLDDLTQLVSNYRAHLKAVYELETYYGDETIKNLLDHTRSLSTFLEDYEEVIDILQPLELIEQEEINENEKEEEIIEKDVLYAGSRRRNS